MPKAIQLTLIVPAILLFVFLFAMFPIVLQADQQWHWNEGFSSIRDYFAGIGSGESFRYLAGKTELSFWEQIGANFKTTLFYVSIGSAAGTLIGLLLGVYFGVSRREGLKRFVELTSVLPDFVVIILLQFLIVFIYSKTDWLVFEVASTSRDDPAIGLPLISAIIIPANYMLRNVAMHMGHTLSEDYISYAKARGLGKTYIVFFHALPNVLPYVKADLHKFMGIMFGNLFIFEYLYNISGLSMMVFNNAFADEGYQYSLVVNGVVALLVLYLIVYAWQRLLLYGIEKVFAR